MTDISAVSAVRPIAGIGSNSLPELASRIVRECGLRSHIRHRHNSRRLPLGTFNPYTGFGNRGWGRLEAQRGFRYR